MLEMKQAQIEESEEVLDFYNVVTEGMKNEKYNSGWQVGVYPDKEFVDEAIQNGWLYIAREEKEIVCGFVINHNYHEGYNEIKWENNFTPEEILVVHALAVRPSYQGKGAAKQMCRFIQQYAEQTGTKAVRLEVYGINKAAQNLYTSLGFIFKGSVEMYYDDTGLDEYLVYEYLI